MSGICGNVDGFERPRRIFGWVTDGSWNTTRKLDVQVKLDGTLIGRSRADQPRPDLHEIGDGSIAFDFVLDQDIDPAMVAIGRLSVEAHADGVKLGMIAFHPAVQTWTVIEGARDAVGVLVHAAQSVPIAELDRAIAEEVAQLDEPSRASFARLFAGPLPSPQIDPSPARQADSHADELRNLYRRFESLGANCEFGLVQRRYGVEEAALFRWGASWRGLDGVVTALRERMVRAGKSVTVYVDGTEYISRDEAYDFVFHTDRQVGSIGMDVLIRNERARIGYLARALIEHVEGNEKLFVYKAVTEQTQASIEALSDALRAIGPVTLLWIVVAERVDQIGTVERIGAGLLKGYIDRFSPNENVHAYCSCEIWTLLCKKALALVEASAEAAQGIPHDAARPSKWAALLGFLRRRVARTGLQP